MFWVSPAQVASLSRGKTRPWLGHRRPWSRQGHHGATSASALALTPRKDQTLGFPAMNFSRRCRWTLCDQPGPGTSSWKPVKSPRASRWGPATLPITPGDMASPGVRLWSWREVGGKFRNSKMEHLPKVLVAQSCLTSCSPMDCSPPGPFVHGVSWATILEGVAISFSRGSFRPRDQTWISCTAGRFYDI